MMRKLLFAAVLCAGCTIVSAQVAEVSVSGGVSHMGGGGLVPNADPNTNPDVTLGNGFRLAIRLTINNWRYFGNEFGYGYAHSSLNAGGQSVGMGTHQGFYNFLAYATHEGSPVRPFLTGGGQFTSFVPPGASISYGNQISKWGFNYGGGFKFKLSGPWGARVDVRQYNMGKPDILQLPQPPSGRLKMTEFTAGISYNL